MKTPISSTAKEMSRVINPSRRQFLKLAGISGGGLIIGMSLTGCSGSTAPAVMSRLGEWVPNAFLQITADNRVIFHHPRDEMGQGSYMGLTTLIAEELDISPARIEVVIVGSHPDYTHPEYGAQLTGGSSSMRVHYLPIRQTGANARQLLLEAASQQLNIPIHQLSTNNRAIVHVNTQDNKRYPIGNFVKVASTLTLKKDAPLKKAELFKYIGSEIPRIDAMAKSTGTAMYGIDADMPNLHRAVVIHSPVAGGNMKSYDASQALQVAGVVHVMAIFSGVAVVAGSYWAAKKGAEMLQVDWDFPELANYSTADIRQDYQHLLATETGDTAVESGDADADISNSNHSIDRQYWTPYLSHSPMEPMNAIVHIQDEKAEVWASNQSPQAAQSMASRYGDVDVENIKVHGVFAGGGFGRRSYLTHVGEAAELSRKTKLPIQVIWSRESDTRDGYFRPASLISLKASVNEAGIIDVWQVKRVGANLAPTSIGQFLPVIMPSIPQTFANWANAISNTVHDAGWTIDKLSVEGMHEDYDWANKRISHITKDHGIPTMFWRSVGHSFTAFAKECAIDELAHQANINPVTLRLKNCNNNPRLAHVIRIAGNIYNRGASEQGCFLGLAAHGSFRSFVAQVAEVSVTNGTIKVHKVTCIVDCGIAVNPPIIRDQMAGAIMFGLTAALHGNIDIQQGRVMQGNFHEYPILRMNEAPKVEVIIVDSKEPPTGVGEPGVPPIAPAVANAIFAATSQRLTEMPFKLS